MRATVRAGARTGAVVTVVRPATASKRAHVWIVCGANGEEFATDVTMLRPLPADATAAQRQ
jgi:hypothetical protein